MSKDCNPINFLPKLVNGPDNMIRMEGTVNGKKKTIYIMSDTLNYVTECSLLPNLDVHNYLDVFFRNVSQLNATQYDMFFFSSPGLISHIGQVQEQFQYAKTMMIYISKMDKLFVQNMSYDPQKNIMKRPQDYPHTRFHIMDFLTPIFDVTNSFFMHALQIQFMSPADFIGYVLKERDAFYQAVQDLKLLKYFINPALKDANIGKKYTQLLDAQQEREIMEEMFRKIRHQYKDPKIKEFIHKIIKQQINPEIDNQIKEIEDFIKSIPDQYTMDLNIILPLMTKFQETFQKIDPWVSISVLFTLRRILDKEYVNHAILYFPSTHALALLIFLHQFGFQVTHSDSDKDKLMNSLKSGKNLNFITDYQCVDMSRFPPNFE